MNSITYLHKTFKHMQDPAAVSPMNKISGDGRHSTFISKAELSFNALYVALLVECMLLVCYRSSLFFFSRL